MHFLLTREKCIAFGSGFATFPICFEVFVTSYLILLFSSLHEVYEEFTILIIFIEKLY